MLKAVRKAPVFRDRCAAHTRRHEDTDSARLWLAEGIPMADILTALEVRRRFEFSPHDCRAYAVEVLWAAREAIRTKYAPQITRRKEPVYAVA